MIQFELLPILDIMIDLYKKPIGAARFQAYLKQLQGDTKGDLVLPIGGFNPMAKPHLVEKLAELKAIQAETIIQKTLFDLNQSFKRETSVTIFKVALNVADDLEGSWTNRFTTDYDSKFKLNALVKRQFCTPFCWSSESYSADLVQERTLESALRTLHWLKYPKPKTLQEHANQEIFAAPRKEKSLFAKPELFTKHCQSDSYAIVFNFLYGDEASIALGLPVY